MLDKYKQDVTVFKALSDENRLKILELLSDGQKCACILLEKLYITQPTLSHHMKILYESGLVDKFKQGKWTHYSLSKEGDNSIRRLAEMYSSAKNTEVSHNACKPAK